MGAPAARRGAVLVLGVFLLASLLGGGPALGPAAAQADQPEADNTATRIELAANGTAHWRVDVRTRLRTEGDVAEYERFQTDFRGDTARYLDPFRDRIVGVVDNAENVTGRPMAATGFAASTHVQQVPRRWGVVTFEFTWAGFAATSGEAVVVGDVFEGGFFLARNDTLTVAAPPGYAVAEVEPRPGEREPEAVTYTGREDFADGRPLVRFVPSTLDGDGGTDPGTGPFGPDDLTAFWPAVAAVAVVVGAVAIWWFRRRGLDRSAAAEAVADSTDGLGGIVTDEDRVRRALEAHGGRMRQRDLAEELGWSSSKTSRVLSDMAEAGTVEKLRLGRENVIDLVEAD